MLLVLFAVGTGGLVVWYELYRSAHPSATRLLGVPLPQHAQVLASAGQMNIFAGTRYFTISMSHSDFQTLSQSLGLTPKPELFQYLSSDPFRAPPELNWPAVTQLTSDTLLFQDQYEGYILMHWENGILYFKYSIN